MMNQGFGYSTFWAPVINLAREPRWGRNLETAGEDPYALGEYAAAFVRGMQVLTLIAADAAAAAAAAAAADDDAFVRGMQSAPEDPHHLLASACCKHFVRN